MGFQFDFSAIKKAADAQKTGPLAVTAASAGITGSTQPLIVSIQSEAFPDRYIRNWNNLGWVDIVSNDQDRKDATIELVPGFAERGNGKVVTLKLAWTGALSNSLPLYFRHWAFRVKLDPEPADNIYYKDFTFWKIEPSLSGTPGYVSFRSYNFPDKYLHARPDKALGVDAQDGDPNFAALASFKVVGPVFAPPNYVMPVPKVVEVAPIPEVPRPDPGLAPVFFSKIQQGLASLPPAAPVPFPDVPATAAAVQMPEIFSPGDALPMDAVRAALPAAVLQATGIGPAQSQLGAVMGAGLGGITKGTGRLPGALGIASRRIFGTPFVPHPYGRPDVRFILEASGPFATSVERLGRAILSPFLGLSKGFLGELRGGFDDAQHLVGDEDRFRAHILTLLRELTGQIRKSAGAFPPVFGVVQPAYQAPAPGFASAIRSAQTIAAQPVIRPATAAATPVNPFIAAAMGQNVYTPPPMPGSIAERNLNAVLTGGYTPRAGMPVGLGSDLNDWDAT